LITANRTARRRGTVTHIDRYGVGVSSNATRAAELFALAAEQGDIVALREKAVYFSSGHGGHPISEALAVLYLSLASNAADPIASTILGSRHLTGHGVPRCCSCAVKLLLPVAKDIIKSAVVPSGAPQLERRRVTRAMAAGFTKSEHRDFQSDSDVFACVPLPSFHSNVESLFFILQLSCLFFGSWRCAQHHAGDAAVNFLNSPRLTLDRALSQLASMYLHGSRGVRRNFTEGARKAFRFPSFVT
jgi:TPR repeat protein